MTSILPNKPLYLSTKAKNYWHSVSQHFLKTPERSLEIAYQAVLKIKAIEDEHFNGDTISIESNNGSSSTAAFLKINFEKNLTIVKLRTAEFKASCFLLDARSSSQLTKLKLIDEIFNKYVSKQDSSELLALPANTESLVGKSEQAPYTPVVTDKSRPAPKSIGRTINDFKNSFNPKTEQEVIRKYRSSRAKTITAIRFLATLIFVPLLVQQLAKPYVVEPIVDQFRGETQPQIFLNYEMKEEALHELQSFEEGLKFENLINVAAPLAPEAIEEKVKFKATEIAEEFKHKSSGAIDNVFADLIAVVAFGLVLVVSKKEIVILKSFMDDLVGGMSDSTKAFIIILFTDLFVGFHSPHGWEVILEGVASHIGVPANRNLIFLFIATVPVIMDTIFKYCTFRYLTRISPSALATLRNMNE
jgi:CemA family